MNIWRTAWAFITLLVSISAQAGSISLGQAANYNMFVKENFQAQTADTEGAAAIGGNLIINGGYDFGAVNAGSASTVTVGGNVIKSGDGNLGIYDGKGTGITGDLVYAGSLSKTGVGGISGAVSQGATQVDFNSAFAHLTALSNQLASMTTGVPNREANTQDGILKFTPAKTGADNIYVFNITQADLNQFHTIRVDDKNISKDALIVFNLSNPTGVQATKYVSNPQCPAGNSQCLSLTEMRYEVGALNSSSSAIANKVLFNFNTINDLRITASTFGSILAPNAAITNQYGVIWGQVMAKSWSGNMQVNWTPLTVPPGGNTSVSSPTPVWLLLILPLLLWRRRQPPQKTLWRIAQAGA